jgi:hypothetical protein
MMSNVEQFRVICRVRQQIVFSPDQQREHTGRTLASSLQGQRFEFYTTAGTGRENDIKGIDQTRISKTKYIGVGTGIKQPKVNYTTLTKKCP